MDPLYDLGQVYMEKGRPSFYKGQKIAPLYMQNLVPRAIAIIEFGAERDNQLFSVNSYSSLFIS